MKRILIVDDIEENLELQRILLEGHGYEVEQACNGSEAIAKALEKVPDMIISDILMPIMDGFTLCRKLKADERLKRVPFVFCTATYTDPRDERLAMDMGAVAFIVKPVEPAEFLRLIEEVLATGKEYSLPSPPGQQMGNETINKEYNETLIRKLEKKMLELERVNRELEVVIAAKSKTESELIESELRYRTIADSGQALIWTSGTDRKYDYFNKPWLTFTGRMLEQELGDGWAQGVHPDDLDRCITIYVTAFDRRESFSMVYRLRRNDGEYRWILDDGKPRYNANGDFIGYIGHCLDITERKQDEVELQRQLNELQRWYATMLDREDRVLDLKKEVNDLLKESGKPARYGG